MWLSRWWWRPTGHHTAATLCGGGHYDWVARAISVLFIHQPTLPCQLLGWITFASVGDNGRLGRIYVGGNGRSQTWREMWVVRRAILLFLFFWRRWWWLFWQRHCVAGVMSTHSVYYQRLSVILSVVLSVRESLPRFGVADLWNSMQLFPVHFGENYLRGLNRVFC